MPKITYHLHAEIDLSRQPVPELCDVIAAVLQAYPGREREILIELSKAIDGHLKVIEEADKRGKTVPETRRS